MKQVVLPIIVLHFIFIGCTGNKNNEIASADSVAADVPVAASIQEHESSNSSQPGSEYNVKLTEVLGDLDKDKIDEKIQVYNTNKEGDLGIERKVVIFKHENNDWILWHQCNGPVLPSRHGGVMGEPFEDISIEKGCIVISHSGGSRDKWSYIHRYRFQNDDWYLIGATIGYGEPACNWFTYDYNLSTGKIEIDRSYFDCQEEGSGKDSTSKSTEVYKLESLPKMDNFYPGDNKVKLASGDIFYY